MNDAEVAPANLQLSATSSNPGLVPVDNIVFGGGGTDRTVTVTPTMEQTGSATITVTVNDGPNNTSTNFVVTVSSVTITTQTFTNAAQITIPDSGAATPYPSAINVSGMTGPITNLTVNLKGLTHTWAGDIDVLLVGPTGQKSTVMSDAGTGATNNANLVFSDAATSALPQSGALVSGTYKPTDYPPDDTYPAPAPAGPYGTVFSTFNGASANGNWSLYVFDDGPGDQGKFATGWSVTITTATISNNPPVAALIAYPVGQPANPPRGDPPLAIHFDASGSSDPDAGDSVSSYTFDFGDGSAPVTQASPTIDHNYTTNGNFAAHLTVKDTHNLVSSNTAIAAVVVNLPLTDVLSRKVHGGAGTFDIDLNADVNGNYNVECRSEGTGYTIVYTFDTAYSVTGNATSVTVSNGGTVASHGAGPNANQYQVVLTGPPDALTHLVTLSGLPVHSSATAVNGGNATLNSAVGRLDLLVGDTTNDRSVNSADVGQTKAASGQTVGAGNFRNDDTVDGALNSADVGLTKSKSGTALPPLGNRHPRQPGVLSFRQKL